MSVHTRDLQTATSAYRGTGTAASLLRDRVVLASGLGAFARGFFSLGTLEWTSGANAGRIAEIASHDLADGLALLTLLEAPVRPVGSGDGLIVRAGCDKRASTCRAKFANIANFRGFPHIPGQDTVLRYASRDGNHRGTVL